MDGCVGGVGGKCGRGVGPAWRVWMFCPVTGRCGEGGRDGVGEPAERGSERGSERGKARTGPARHHPLTRRHEPAPVANLDYNLAHHPSMMRNPRPRAMSDPNVTIVHVRPTKPLTNRARDAPLAQPHA